MLIVQFNIWHIYTIICVETTYVTGDYNIDLLGTNVVHIKHTHIWPTYHICI